MMKRISKRRKLMKALLSCLNLFHLRLKSLDRKNIEINPLLEKYGEYVKKINNVLDLELDLNMDYLKLKLKF